jgi:hypothetical protein
MGSMRRGRGEREAIEQHVLNTNAGKQLYLAAAGA